MKEFNMLIICLLIVTIAACKKDINIDQLADDPCPNNIKAKDFKKFRLDKQPYIILPDGTEQPYIHTNMADEYQTYYNANSATIDSVSLRLQYYGTYCDRYFKAYIGGGKCLLELRIEDDNNQEVFYYTELNHDNFFQGKIKTVYIPPIDPTRQYTLYYRFFTSKDPKICCGAITFTPDYC